MVKEKKMLESTYQHDYAYVHFQGGTALITLASKEVYDEQEVYDQSMVKILGVTTLIENGDLQINGKLNGKKDVQIRTNQYYIQFV